MVKRISAVVLGFLLLAQPLLAQTVTPLNSLSAATSVSPTDTVPLCQVATGCGTGNPLKTATQGLLWNQQLNAAFDPKLSTTAPASGSATTTTGSGGASSASLTVASASTWSAGMGIAVAGAGSAGAELDTTISSCGVSSGACISTTFTLATNILTTVSGAAVKHDDTAAIASALANNSAVRLSCGTYNITSNTTISTAVDLIGENQGCVILQDRIVSGTMFTISACSSATPVTITYGMMWGNFRIVQDAAVTPTGGQAFDIKGTSSSCYVQGLVMAHIDFHNLWVGMFFEDHQIQNWFEDLSFSSMGSNIGIYYNTASPGGDDNFKDIAMNPCAGVRITQSDIETWINLKVNACSGQIGVDIAGGVGSVSGVRFINPSVEGPLSCSFNFGSGVSQISIIGGEVFDATTGYLCGIGSTTLVTVDSLLDHSNGAYINYENSTAVVSCSSVSTSTAVVTNGKLTRC